MLVCICVGGGGGGFWIWIHVYSNLYLLPNFIIVFNLLLHPGMLVYKWSVRVLIA